MVKKIITIAFAAAMLIGTTSAFAQEGGIVTEENTHEVDLMKASHLNLEWFAGGGIGFNSTWDYENKGKLPFVTVPSLAAEVYGGAWITPAFGVRLGYYGVANDAGLTLSPFSYSPFETLQNMLAVDFLWNIRNPFVKEDMKSEWSFAPYARLGVDFLASGSDAEGKKVVHTMPAAGLGCLVMWSPSWLGKGWSLTLDDRFVLVSEKHLASEERKSTIVFPFAITVGMSYHFGKGAAGCCAAKE